jgi:hypothetical protein
MNRFLISISLIFLTFLLSCTKIDQHELPGSYVFNQTNTRDTIIISTNGTYVHTAYRNNERQLNTGNWKFNGVEIAFHNFTFFYGGTGVWFSRVIQEGDNIKLNYADEEVFYLKLK